MIERERERETEIDPNPQDAPVEALPQQEEFYRAPARFGSIPVEAEPKGWDRREGFRKHYPSIDLPTQIVERVSLGSAEPHEPNRLIWGDNLHVMRQMPSGSVDLIYIDPPFFSGRQYNVMWGDNNELRSFNDIWEGGMDGYLVWLNARLYEMKRLLKPTGSIYVHCDYHASHYIKVEMDRIFGHQNFINEVVWCYELGGRVSRRAYGRRHDTILFYAKSANHTFNWDEVLIDWDERGKAKFRYEDEHGKYRLIGRFIQGSPIRGHRDVSPSWEETHPELVQRYYMKKGKAQVDHWNLSPINQVSAERLGYPTQKPEVLLERIIKASSNQGDVVADFFIGGGTTAAVAQRLGRRFIACDQSRVAVAVTAERLKQQAITRGMEDAPIPDFTVEQWGIYEAERLSAMPADQFRDFVLRAYGSSRIGETGDGPDIHGWRNQLPIWVGEPALESQAGASDVQDFANAIRRTPQYQQANLRDGVMLAWGFRPDAVDAAEQLRQQETIDVNFVRLKQVRIGDADFREHIIGRSTDKADYSEFLTFVQPPVVSVGYRALGGGSVTFDAGDTAVVNPGAEMVNVQWDFNYDGRHFAATPGYSFPKDRKIQVRVTHKFPRPGKHQVACRVQDSRGGEGLWVGEVETR